MTKEEYIEKYKNDAIKDMQRTGVPASITMAQGILESQYGNSELVREAKNHFGIKCHKGWDGETYFKDDDAKNECFRKYKTALESFDDHSSFLRSRARYASLFSLNIDDYKGWAHGLKKAGYATNPQYGNKLIKIIEDYNLQEYDKAEAIASSEKIKEPGMADNDHSEIKNSSKASMEINNVPFVIADNDDSYFSIANDQNLPLAQILKYNDLQKTGSPKSGEIIFLKTKKNKAKEKFHIVNEGETLREISQLHAVKLSKICKRNYLTYDAVLKPGQKILLK